jgi:DnaJ-class molecular chaperone
MTGKEYIEWRINTGDRFLVNLHKDSRDLLASILEQYAALRQPLVISSVCHFCNGSGKLGTLDECRDCDKCNGTGQTDL